jgi:hypothetical protein
MTKVAQAIPRRQQASAEIVTRKRIVEIDLDLYWHLHRGGSYLLQDGGEGGCHR